MGEAELRDLDAGTLAPLRLFAGIPLGGMRFDDAHNLHPGSPLAGMLRLAGSRQLPARYPIALQPSQLDDVASGLSEARGRRRIDPYWVTVAGHSHDDDRLVVALLTNDQALSQVDLLSPAEPTEVVLPNGQILSTTSPDAGAAWLDRGATLELQRIKYVDGIDGSIADGDELFQALPSGEYARRLSSSHSYRCLLALRHRRRFPSGFASVRNPLLEHLYPGPSLDLAVLVGFSREVPDHTVVVDETVATGIGLRPGEIVAVAPLPEFSTQLAQRSLSFRHSLCRVHGSNTTDMEKPLVRLPEEVLDIIGVNPGHRVVVESFDRTPGGEARRRQIVVRALPWRGESWPEPKPGVPDILMETGSQDLPPVTLDLACQQELHAPRGSVVYVRPAVGSLIIDEWSSAATAVVLAAFGAAVLGSVVLAVLLVAMFVMLLGLQLWRRLR